MMQLWDTIKVTFLTVPLLAIAWPTLAQDNFTPNVKPSLHVQRAVGDIRIDGRLDDAGWQGVAVADNFCETSPGDNIKPPVETKAYMTYDNDKLYVAIVAYDNPADIRASMCERDRTQGDDNLGFHLDTYGDADWGYVFFINRHGVQYDALWTADFGWDTRYDLIWESAGHLTDSGFQVEIAIPFASLRFPNEPVQNWKVNFVRYHEREVSHYLAWHAEDRDEPCELCQLGPVTGIENVKPGRGIEIISAMTGYQSGALVIEDSGALDFENEDADGELSVSAKYALSSSATAEFAINPDFSQVEADADQIDVNSTTALSFPEKRPFFQEGADLFRTIFDVVYTRSINDPSFAAKATARIGRTSLAYLSAYDEHSPLLIPLEEFGTGADDIGRSLSNIVRARQSFGENSRIGLLATDRRYNGGGSGSAFSLDGYFRLNQQFSLNWQAIASHVSERNDPGFTDTLAVYDFTHDTIIGWNDFVFDTDKTIGWDGESYWGHGYIGLLDYETGNAYISGRYSETSPTLRFDDGFLVRNNRRQASIIASYTFRFDEGLIESINPDIFPARIWNTDGVLKDEYVYLNLSTRLRKAQADLHTQYLASNELYGGTQYRGIWNFHQCAHFTVSQVLSFGGNIGYGDQLAYRYRTIGRNTRVGFWLDINPSDRVFVENRINYVQSRDQESDVLLYKGFTARSRLGVQFSKELSLRFVAQYNDFSETWDFDPLLTYRINPFTMFYIGTTYDYCQMYGLNKPGTAWAADGDPTYDHNRLTSRQFFMKLQYLFQI